MKKIFTLALTLFILNAAFSQAYVSRVSFRTPHFSINVGSRYAQPYSYNNYDRNCEIKKINDRYNQDVSEVMSLHIGAARKVRLIRQLEIERTTRINKLGDRFYTAGNGYNNQYNHSNW